MVSAIKIGQKARDPGSNPGRGAFIQFLFMGLVGLVMFLCLALFCGL